MQYGSCLVHAVLGGRVVGKVVGQQVVVRVGDAVHQGVEVCGVGRSSRGSGGTPAVSSAVHSIPLRHSQPFCTALRRALPRPAGFSQRRLVVAFQSGAILTVGPAKLAGADHVDNVQEAVVRLELGALLAQLHTRVGGGWARGSA